MITIPATEVVEVIAIAGLDWLFVDGEHGPLDTSDLRRMLSAAGNRIDCLVRVPAIDETPIKKALDLGATGIIAPQIRTAEDAERVVKFCKYPPQGSRGMGAARAHGFGLQADEYLERANRDTLVVIQIEHRDAVTNIDAIAAVPGIDCLFIGPYDLSASMGKIGQVDDAEVVAAIQKVEQVSRQNEIPLGYFGVTNESVKSQIERGFRLICVGVDAAMLGQAALRIKQLKT